MINGNVENSRLHTENNGHLAFMLVESYKIFLLKQFFQENRLLKSTVSFLNFCFKKCGKSTA